MWTKLIHTTLITLILITTATHCSVYSNSTLELERKPDRLNYVQLGETIVLNVTMQTETCTSRIRVKWRTNDSVVAVSHARFGYAVHAHNYRGPRVTIEGVASLVIRNATLKDNGTYLLVIHCRGFGKFESSFEVIVQVMPDVFSNCSDMTVNEGDNVTCVCEVSNGNPATEVSWIWTKSGKNITNSNTIFTLQGISRNQSGIYTCQAKSHDFVNKTSFRIHVIKRIIIKSFKVFQLLGNDPGQLLIVCEADGIPAPTYSIRYNGNVEKIGNVLKVDSKELASPHLYECLARNEHGVARSWLLLNESIFGDESSKEVKSRCNAWYVTVTATLCAFAAGNLFLYMMMRYGKKFRKEETHQNSDIHLASVGNHDEQPQNLRHRLESVNDYDVVEVRTKIKNWKSLKKNEEATNESRAEDEHEYQELNQFRDHDDGRRYQSLIPAVS